MAEPHAAPSSVASSQARSDSDQVNDRLDSWKEIAAYLNRDVTTVQRWEKREGMPVHRHVHDRMGSVYASRAELDAWVRSRNLRGTRQNRNGVTLDDIPIPPPPSPSLQPHSDNAQAWTTQVGLSPGSKISIPKLRWLLLAACVAVIFSVSVWIRHQRQPADPPIRSLAVLPLDDLSPGTREEYFADGMTDELITELAKIPNLRVVSRASVMQVKGTRKPLAQIGRELNVDAIVEGSVVRSGARVRHYGPAYRCPERQASLGTVFRGTTRRCPLAAR